MVVTKEERRRGHLVEVTLDDGTVFSVDKTTWDESAYSVGSSLSTQNLQALAEQSDMTRAKERALYLLSLQDYPAATLSKKVADGGVSRAAAEAAVERLIEVGLVDDERLAGRMARDMVKFKHYPQKRLEQELQKRGIPREIAVNAAAEAAENQNDLQQALALLEKKYYNKVSTEDDRRKTTAALLRFGFSYEITRQAIRAVAHAEDEDES